MKRQFSIATLNMTSNAPGMIEKNNGGAIDDISLMESIAKGDRNAFSVFLSRHLSAVVQFSKRYLSSLADAEDIAQETFFRVWQKGNSWQSQGYSPRSWLYRIAYNLCIDEIRRQPASEQVNNDIAEKKAILDSGDLEKTIEYESDINWISRSLKKLPERQRTALSLCALQGLSNKEAANVMDISTDALESLLSRGRRQLREQLQQDGENSHE
jgi:RNA polymerase sigma-70 factor (ECF subfamily)